MRITPAYAGKSVAKKWNETGGEDHPRVCGEKVLLPHRRKPFMGSPPRMRGKVKCVLCSHGLRRITPAYAGKSSHQPDIMV